MYRMIWVWGWDPFFKERGVWCCLIYFVGKKVNNDNESIDCSYKWKKIEEKKEEKFSGRDENISKNGRRPDWGFQVVDVDQNELFYWSTSTRLSFSTGQSQADLFITPNFHLHSLPCHCIVSFYDLEQYPFAEECARLHIPTSRFWPGSKYTTHIWRYPSTSPQKGYIEGSRAVVV